MCRATERILVYVQVDGCSKDLSKEKDYYQRYRICEEHLKLSSLIKDGIEQRFCQQCGRFHVLADFDADKRCEPPPRIRSTWPMTDIRLAPGMTQSNMVSVSNVRS